MSKIAICRPRTSRIIHLQCLRWMRQNDFCFHSTAILYTKLWRQNGMSYSTLIQFFARIVYLFIFIQGVELCSLSLPFSTNIYKYMNSIVICKMLRYILHMHIKRVWREIKMTTYSNKCWTMQKQQYNRHTTKEINEKQQLNTTNRQ